MSNKPSPVNIVLLFADHDEAWRVALLNHLSSLKNEGRITLWDVSQIAAGTNRVAAIEQHLASASVILLLVSAACLTSHDHEIKQALHRQKTGDVLVVPILLHPVDWQHTRLAHLQPLPGNGTPITMWQSQEAAFAEVVAGIRKALPAASHIAKRTHAFALPPIWNVPCPRNPFFTGRDEILKRIHTQLQAGQATALSQAQVISGLGGIGKTQIAVEYAYQHRHDYQAVLWVLADTRESLVSGYLAIAQLLDLPQKNEQDQAVIIGAVKSWLQVHNPWLLILDNADEPELLLPFLPPLLGGHLLVTTRANDLTDLGMGFTHSLSVHTFRSEDGARFLLNRAGRALNVDEATPSDRTQALRISEALGGLPLALDQAGAYIKATGSSLEDYERFYQQYRLRLLKDRRGRQHPESVATTWSISFQRIEEKNPAATDLLRFCAFLAPDAIPEELIMKGARFLGPRLSPMAADAFLLAEAIATLRTYSLLDCDTQMQSVSIHRLVQAVLRDTMDEQTQKQWAERAVLAVNEVFPGVKFEMWSQCERYLPHALVCAELIEQEQVRDLQAAELLNKAGGYLHYRARYIEAEPLYRRALSFREQQLGMDHADVGASLNNLALLYKTQGKYEAAEPLYQRALSIHEQQFGEMHPLTATSLNNLALLYKTQGKYEAAEPLYQRALVIHEQQFGEMHPDTAVSLNNLAALYYVQGKYEAAEPLYQRALSICEQRLGEMHPLTATSLNNLAGLYWSQEIYERAEPLIKRALSIDENAYGSEHPDVARDLHNLATLYDDQGKYELAEPLFKRALLIWRQTLGETHPNTQRVRRWYISLLRKMGRNDEATAFETGQLPSEEHERLVLDDQTETNT